MKHGVGGLLLFTVTVLTIQCGPYQTTTRIKGSRKKKDTITQGWRVVRPIAGVVLLLGCLLTDFAWSPRAFGRKNSQGFAGVAYIEEYKTRKLLTHFSHA